MLVDTHTHIQFADYPLDGDEVWADARKAGVAKILVVGDDVESSQLAIDFAKKHNDVYAVVGVHPHNSAKFLAEVDSKLRLEKMLDDAEANKIVGVGEFGLDYYYKNSPKEAQIEVLKYQLELLQKYGLPANFHIRESFDDFWPIFDEFQAKSAISGVVHCFTSYLPQLEQALNRGLYVALNGIMTFAKDEKQLEAAKAIPLDKLLLETDAPFLTPAPFRGKICKPEHIVHTAEFLASLRGEALGVVTSATTQNAIQLFNLK